MPLFFPSGADAATPQVVASVCQHHFTKDFDHRVKTIPFENLADSLQEIRSQVRNCDTGEGTLVTPACDKTRQDEAACDPVAQVEPCFLDWVDGLSQVAGTMRCGKAIGVDSIPPEACRVAGKAYWCQLAEIAKQVVSCNQFPDAWKGGIMCGAPRKQESFQRSSSHAESVSPLQPAP